MELDKLLDRMASEIRISENDAVNSDSPHIVINCIETSISFFSDNTITVERSVNGESERYRYICEDSSFMEKLEIMVKNPRFDELCPSCSKFDCLDGPVYVTWNNKYFELSNSQFKKLDSTFSLISQDVYATYPSKNFANSEFDSIFYTNKNVNTEIRLYDESIFCMVVKDEDFERTDTYWYECETGHSLKNEVEKIISDN